MHAWCKHSSTKFVTHANCKDCQSQLGNYKKLSSLLYIRTLITLCDDYAARGRAWDHINDVPYHYLVLTSLLDARHPARSGPSSTPQWHIPRQWGARNFRRPFCWPWGALTDRWHLLLCWPDWHWHTEAIWMPESMSRFRGLRTSYSECVTEIRSSEPPSWWTLS